MQIYTIYVWLHENLSLELYALFALGISRNHLKKYFYICFNIYAYWESQLLKCDKFRVATHSTVSHIHLVYQ